MSHYAPPPPPTVLTATGDDDRMHRLRFRLWQIAFAMITIFATVWLMMFGIPILSIVALAVAKHVLVAIYVMGLDIYSVHQSST